MAVNAFLTFFDEADGESTERGKENWIEIQAWDWEVEADTNWTKGGGASVGKPRPGRLSWEQSFDSSSTAVLGRLCTGTSFPKAELQMLRTTDAAELEAYFTMTVQGAYITKVTNSGTEEGNVTQRVEMVFKSVNIDYVPKDVETGQRATVRTFNWDIPAGTASPSG